MANRQKKAWAVIARRELGAYFSSPMAYIVGGLFLLASGFLFFSAFFLQKRAELREFFELLPILYTFFIPALSMRIFSEEKKSGTLETLVTLPVTADSIIIGKYAALVISSVVMIAPTVFYVITCFIFGNPNPGPIIGGYAGAVLLSAAFCAIGLFASSVTKNQIIAFFVSLAICAVLSIINIFVIFVPGSLVQLMLFLSATSHFNSISRGIIDSRDVIYFVSITALFLALTVRTVKNSKRG
ncbi:MAG: ABC transporter permease subunit [Treponema sp.]|nr:ABC transporter permease subunit [Treponema sp.]